MPLSHFVEKAQLFAKQMRRRFFVIENPDHHFLGESPYWIVSEWALDEIKNLGHPVKIVQECGE